MGVTLEAPDDSNGEDSESESDAEWVRHVCENGDVVYEEVQAGSG